MKNDAEFTDSVYQQALTATASELETRVLQFGHMARIGKLFECSSRLEDVASKGLEILLETSLAENGSIMLYTSEKDELCMLAAGSREGRVTYYGPKGHPRRMFGLGEGLAGGSLIGGEPAISTDVANDPRFIAGKGRVKIGSMICLPMIINGRPLGVINLSHPEVGVIAVANVPVLTLLAGYLAVAVSNALLLVQLRSANDELQTKVNRRTRSLEEANQKLTVAQAKIADHNEQLKQRVDERTRELTQTLEELNERTGSLERANRIKDEFLNNINHELKTPLNAIIGYSGLLKREAGEALSASQLSDMELIEANGKHLQQIIDNIFALKAIEGGDVKPDLVATDLEQLLQVATSSVAPRARAKAVEMVYEANKKPLPDITLDPTLVRRVIYNLLDNAVKFSAEGTITVRALILKQKGGADQVLVEVQDEGKGVLAEDVDRIFDKFQQAEPAMQKHEGGSGVGLTIARTLVELHGGRLRYAPGPTGGSIFSFTLPLG